MLTAQELYEEYTTDPSGLYTGLDAEIAYRDSINLIRASIQVTRTSVDNGSSPGRIVEPIPVQAVRDAMHESEFRTANEADRESLYYYTLGDGETIQFTDALKSNLLAILTNVDWPLSRAALIELQTRDGSRSEELQGLATSFADNQAVQEYWTANTLPNLW